jgi:SNF2 family DNA or RNA helicase
MPDYEALRAKYPNIKFPGQEKIEPPKPAEVFRHVPMASGEIIELNPAKHSTEVISTGNDYIEATESEAGIRLELESLEAEKKAMENQIDEIRKTMQKQIDVIRQQITAFDDEHYYRIKSLRQSLREAVRRVDSLMAQFRQALENELATEKFKSSALEFDRITAGLKWREFAYSHQIEGAKYFAANKRVILGDKMGLGKSLTSLIACDMLQSQKVLVIVPDDVVSNFVHEVVKWTPHRSVFSLGKLTKGERAATFAMLDYMKSYIAIVNYSAWRRDQSLLDSLIERRFDTVIIDEAHTIKETTTNAYKGVKKVVLSENSCPECRGPITLISNRIRESMSHKPNYFQCKNVAGCGWSENRDIDDGVKRPAFAMSSIQNVFPMTGTAILNKPTDLFALLSLIDPVNFGEKYRFEFDYCARDIYTNKIVFRSGGMASLVKRLSGKWLARDRHQAGIVLPKQEIQYHNLIITEEEYPKQLKTITQLTKYATIMLDSGKQMSAIAAIALITRKRQANVWPAGIVQKDMNGDVVFSVGEDVNESIKVDWCINADNEGHLMDFTADGNMGLGDRVVVFSQFKGPLIELENRLRKAGVSVVRFDGDTPEDIRNQVKIDFDRSRCNEPGYEKKWQVCLANYKSGGQGLNFNDATQMVILDSEWNGGREDQAFGRMDRLGQTEQTTVHILEIENTIDTWMRTLIEYKRDLVNGFESNAELAQALFRAMQSGEIL